MRRCETLTKLNEGEIVEIEGLRFRKAKGELQPGDLYIAERNTGPCLLTVREVKMGEFPNNEFPPYPNFVIPTTNHYCYDYPECVKVEEVE